MTHSILPHVSKPARYLGNEYNAVRKDWDKADVRFALIFPDLYEIGMSHLGLQILYHLLNDHNHTLAERCFAPDKDAEEVLRKQLQPLQSLESGRPLTDFDVLGITLPYELCYANILTILDLAGIPFHSRDRNEHHPLLLGGGSCSLNPEPVASFFDAILLGDGEEAIVDISEAVRIAKEEKTGRQQLLEQLSTIEGVYIPAFYTPEYDENDRITNIKVKNGLPGKVNRRIVSNLDAVEHLHHPIVPNAKTVHDRLGIEIARGCTRGCRFCQAGMTYRPVRERTTEQILSLAENGISHSGFEELALLSLSSGDHSCINEILPRLMDKYSRDYVSVSMPSMRVGTLSQPVMDQIKRVRKTGFTVAPEAGSERLREVINKGITEDDLLETCVDAFALGWNTIKLYFMIGLPTETIDDVDAIALLAQKVKNAGSSGGKRRQQVTTSVGTFVPKPHTPFQWQEQLSLEDSRGRIQHLKRVMPKKGIKLKWHDPEMSFLEGVFSRGDRHLALLIEEAWHRGARLDGWSDHFNLEVWQEAAEHLDMDLTSYLRAREGEILPWDHLSSGVATEFLKEEMEKALSRTYTPDCRYNGCQNCGLCDFSMIKPIVHRPSNTPPPQTGPVTRDTPHGEERHYKYMVTYSRRGDISYLGHLEILQLLFRSLRRAGIQTHFSKGFNPSPKISFGGALPVGMESEAEFFIMDLVAPLDDTTATQDRLNACLPEGLSIRCIRLHSGAIPQDVINSYSVTLPRPLTEAKQKAINAYLESDVFFITRERKGKRKDIDIRPLLQELTRINGQTLNLRIQSRSGTPGVKVVEALAQIVSLSEEELRGSTIVKTEWQQLSTS